MMVSRVNLFIPWRITVKAPSGISRILTILALVPMWNRSSFTGSSTIASFCVTVPIMLLDLCSAFTSLSDFSRPTVMGSIVPGNSTASLNARIGNVFGISTSSILALPFMSSTGIMFISPLSIWFIENFGIFMFSILYNMSKCQ